jgi:hypothetical protein
MDFHKFRKIEIYKYQCNWCGKEFIKDKKSKSGYLFCSRECQGEAISKNTSDLDAPRMKYKSRSKSVKQYKRSYIGTINNKVVYRADHRLAMEEHLGRKLRTDEHVHHIDGNGFNNDLSNLMIIKAGKHASITNSGWAKNFSVKLIDTKVISKFDLERYTCKQVQKW